jgi:integrase/recombinase XerD
MRNESTDARSRVSLQAYLQGRHTKGTAERYQRDIANYLQAVTEAKAINATYSDIMDYIDILRSKYSNPETIKVIIQSIKKYYYWLNHTGQRKTHPCRNLKLREKTNRDIQIQDLFTAAELELLLKRKERYSDLKTKNQVIISFLIYQGLTRNDIVNLTLKDIDLNEGTVYIKADTKTNSRTLKLKTKQIMLLHKYVNESRPKLAPPVREFIAEFERDKCQALSGKLILTKLGTPDTGEGISYLLETSKHLFPNRNLNTKTIRQSVIANLLKSGHDLRLVQTFAGHKYPSATERYRQTGIEELKAGIEKYHPLKQ